MLVNMKEILSHAEKNHYAIACINTPSADNIRAVIGAAEELNAPVIIDHAQVHNSVIPIEVIGPQMVACAKAAKVPVCVHLDHGTDYTFIMKAIHAGFSSIMYDCSLLPYDSKAYRIHQTGPRPGHHCGSRARRYGLHRARFPRRQAVDQ